MAIKKPFKIATTPSGLFAEVEAIAPSTSMGFMVTSTNGFYVDWGNGSATSYASGVDVLATGTSSGTIKISAPSSAITKIRFGGGTTDLEPYIDTCLTIDIIDGATLTDCFSMCRRQGNMTSFLCNTLENATTLYRGWEQCISLSTFPNIDISSASDLRSAWNSCESLLSFPLLDMTGIDKQITATWAGCSSLTSFPAMDLTNVTALTSAWAICTGLTTFPNITFSPTLTSLSSCWKGCSGLTSFPNITIPATVTSLGQSWRDCSSLTTFPQLDFSNIEDMAWCFAECTSLTSLPDISAPNCTDFEVMLYDCTSLICVTAIDTSSQTNTNNMFLDTPSLVAPNASEQAALLLGDDWTNSGACP